MMAKRTGMIILILGLFQSLLVALPSQKEHPMSIEQMISIKTIGQVALAPSTDLVAFEVTNTDWEKNTFRTHIWLASTDGQRCFPLTRGDAVNSSPAWSPSGQGCTFLSTRLGKPQVFIFRPGFGEPELLFEAKEGVQKFSWSPDGKCIAFLSAESPDARKIELQKKGFDETAVDESPPRSQLYLYDLPSKEIRPLAPGDYHVVGFSWSPDGQRIAFVTSPKNLEEVIWGTQDMRMVNRDGSSPRILNFKYNAYTILADSIDPIWNPDGQSIALAGGDLGKPEFYSPSMLVHDLKSDTTVNASGENDHFIYDAQWSAHESSVYYLANIAQNSQFFKLDTISRRAEQISHFSQTDVQRFAMAADKRSLVFSASTPTWPQELYFADITTLDNAKRITDLHADVQQTLVGKEEEIEWRSEDGLKIHGLVVYPVGYEEGRKYPTLLIVHGGPLGHFSNSFAAGFFCPAQYFSGKGYLIFLPNFRGSIGWGSDFMRKNIRDWGGGDYKDIMAGLDDLIERGLADKDKLVVWGASYGGYMTNWIVTHTDRFKAAHSEISLSDAISWWATAPVGRISCRMWFEKDSQEDPDLYRRLSPLTYAKRVKTPLLMTQNEKDQRAPLGQAIEFYRAVELTGTPVRLFIYPDEPHPTLKPVHQLDKLRKTENWFETYLK